MPNDNNGPDPLHINIEKAYEVRYWSSTMGCTTTELIAAVCKVGSMTEVVRTFLRNSHARHHAVESNQS